MKTTKHSQDSKTSDEMDTSLMFYCRILSVYSGVHEYLVRTENVEKIGDKLFRAATEPADHQLKTRAIAEFPQTYRYLKENRALFCLSKQLQNKTWWTKFLARLKGHAIVRPPGWRYVDTFLQHLLPETFCLQIKNKSMESLDFAFLHVFTQLARILKDFTEDGHAKAQTEFQDNDWKHIPPETCFKVVAHEYNSLIHGHHNREQLSPEIALRSLEKSSGIYFNPQSVKTFIASQKNRQETKVYCLDSFRRLARTPPASKQTEQVISLARMVGEEMGASDDETKKMEIAVKALEQSGSLIADKDGKGLSLGEAVLEIEAKSGTQFDPEIVDALLKALGKRKGDLPSWLHP